MKDVLNIIFINQKNIVDNDEIKSIIIDKEKEKLNTIIDEEPIVIVGIVSSEDENNEQIDSVFLFSVLRDENIDCNMLFKAIKNIRYFCIENGISFSQYDEYNINIDELQEIKPYITDIEINNLLNLLLDGI